jgi:Protein of unknown function (DUF998)
VGDGRTEQRREDAIRWLAVGSIVGQVAWVAAIGVGGAIEPGYSAYRDAVSMLGALDAARPWLFDTAVAIWGLSFIAAAAALWLDAPPILRGRLGPGLIGFTGLTQILDGFPFPLDCRRTIDAGCRAREVAGELSWPHYAHGYTYLVGAIALLASVFAMAWRFRGDERWGRADALALGAGVCGLAIFTALFFLSDHEPGGDYGLVQRLSLGAGGIYVLALCAGLLAIRGRRGRSAPAAAAVRSQR